MRSVNMKRSLYQTSEDHLTEHDDTTEKQQRHKDSSLPETCKELPLDRKSLSFKDTSSAEMFLHYSQCLKLSADNKINAKNAFQLQLIDYMTNMVKSKDTQMENFQVVSSALDASTKIYASRVDRVHMDGLKMAGGLGKINATENQTEAAEERGIVKLKTSSKNKVNSNLAKNADMLNSTDKDDNRIHPSFLYMKKVFGDCRPGYPVFFTKLNVQDDSNKINFVYSESSTGQGNTELSQCSKPFPELPDISRLKMANYLCEPADLIVDELITNFENFHISPSKCGIDDAIDDLDQQLNMENNFGDEFSTGVFEEDTMNSGIPSSTCEQIKDIRHAITYNSSEYSYFDDSKLLLWAGPSYWKAPFPKGSTTEVKTKKVKTKQKTIILFQEPVDCKKEFLPGKSTKFLRKTIIKSWLPEKITVPQDVKFDFTKLQRYFLQSSRGFNCYSTLSGAPLSEDIEYDYNNLNDTQEFCPNISDDDAENEINEAIDDPKDCILPCDDNEAEDLGVLPLKLNNTQLISPSWNLLAPSYKIARTTVPYALVPKNVNMAHLKTSMWSIITHSQKKSPREREIESDEQEFGPQLLFSNIYNKLPTYLSQDTARDMSVSLAFSSLLHLCNENNLELIGEDDLSDIHIKIK